jgi:MYXO-CTERM domain-containing protein
VDGCSNEPVENCCHDDFDCAIDEVCDGDNNQCVPTDPTGGESSGGDPPTDDSGGESDDATGGATLTSGDPPPGSGSDGSGSDTDDDDAGAANEGGCSCTTGRTGPGALGFVVLAGLVLRRRRVLSGA